jgi:uncharacterized membrane protein
MVADFVLLSGLALRRHATFNTNALDLGYHDQAIWNTLHGRPFRFTVYEQDERAPFWVDVPLARIRDRTSLLSYHVEPLLLLIAPIYLLWDEAQALLVLQAAALTLGAWPAYRLGRRRLGSGWAGVAIALLYLLAPARQAAGLSDFHAVAFTAPLFLWALDSLDARRTGSFVLASLLCLMAREDIVIIVIALTLFAALRPSSTGRRMRQAALALAGISLLYLYLATQVVMPYYNGLDGPTYLGRYSQFGANLKEMALNLFFRPQLYGEWLRRPDILAYLGGLLATGGWVAVAAPEFLVIVLPVVMLNALANTGWPSSGGAHYSVAVVPFLVAAAVYGLDRLGRWVEWLKRRGWKIEARGWRVEDGGWLREDRRWQLAIYQPQFSIVYLRRLQPMRLLILLALVAALGFQIDQGVTPLSRRWNWLGVDGHARLGAEILARIPPGVPVSAQSGLYPHLSHRERIYQFPTVAEVEYIVLDVTSNPAPLNYEGYFRHLRLALINPRFGPLAAGDGYLLLQRGAPRRSPLIEEFLTFTLAKAEEVEHEVKADFGGALRLEGYRLTTLPVIDQRGPHVQLTTFWRPLQTPPENLRPILFHTNAEGNNVYQQNDLPFELYWRPTGEWQADQLYKLTMPELRVGDLAESLLAIIPADSNPDDPTARLPIGAVPGGVTPDTVESGTLLRLLQLPK